MTKQATLTITGHTQVFGIIADPVDHVRAPDIFNPMYEKVGRDAVMIPIHVTPEDLDTVLNGLKAQKNFGGLTITIPHKVEMMKRCDELGSSGKLIGAINAVRFEEDGRLIGDMFDGKGFIAGLKAEGHELKGQKVLQLGAGGAGRAIAFSVAEDGAAELVISNRTMAKAEELAAAVAAAYPDCKVTAGPADPTGLDVVINTTSLGLHDGDDLPVDPGKLTPDMLVAEIIMIPEDTAILVEARKRGCKTHLGHHMLDHQVRLIAEFMGCPF